MTLPSSLSSTRRTPCGRHTGQLPRVAQLAEAGEKWLPDLPIHHNLPPPCFSRRIHHLRFGLQSGPGWVGTPDLTHKSALKDKGGADLPPPAPSAPLLLDGGRVSACCWGVNSPPAG